MTSSRSSDTDSLSSLESEEVRVTFENDEHEELINRVT